MDTLQIFYHDLQNKVQHGTMYDEQQLYQTVFLSIVAEEYMEDQGVDIDPQNFISFQKQGYGRCDGFSFDPTSQELSLFITDYSFDPKSITSLTNTDITDLNKKLLLFFEKACNAGFVASAEESSDYYEMIQCITDLKNNHEIYQLKLIIVSNKVISRKVRKVKDHESPLANVDLFYDIWDLTRFYQLDKSGGSSETVDIQLSQPIPALLASQSEEISSYLCIISGNQLADLYERYTSKLLEANVRSFLQFRAKVNKGIRKTIELEPQYFFAYNNGITATADNVQFDDQGNIIGFKNLQIVNGGQTTVSLYQSRKMKKFSLDLIQVQMKLNLIHSDQIRDQLLSDIAKYANSQNKISDSDLFSNHVFQREFEALSKRIWAPAKPPGLMQTHWFYERARGSYLNAQSGLSAAKKKDFLSQHPKSQLITKTDLSKLKLIFADQPYDAVKGAEIAFNKFREITESDTNKELLNDEYFKMTIAQQIILLTCRRIIRANKNYMGNTKAILTAYTVAMLNQLLDVKGLEFKYSDVWDKQQVHQLLEEELTKLADKIYELLTEKARIQNTALLSYSKTKVAYDSVKVYCSERWSFNQAFRSIVTQEKGVAMRNITESKKQLKQIDQNVDIIKKLCDIPIVAWDGIVQDIRREGWLNPSEIKLIEMVPNLLSGRSARYPTDRQFDKIYQLLISLEDRGYFIFK